MKRKSLSGISHQPAVQERLPRSDSRRAAGGTAVVDRTLIGMRGFLQAQSIIAARALVVHVKDDQAVEFYQHFRFVPLPLDPYHLYLVTRNIHECLA